MRFKHSPLFLLTLLWILFIWGHSLQPATVSSTESKAVLAVLQEVFSMPYIELTEHLLRKAAHFGEYAVLALFLVPSMRKIFGEFRLSFFSTLSAALFIPLVDETIQLFVEGRSGRVSDIWIDIGGFCTGSLIYLLAHGISHAYRKRRRIVGIRQPHPNK